MATKKKSYKIVAHCSYRDGSNHEYVEIRGLSKRDANRYLKERCYTTVSRTFTIEEEKYSPNGFKNEIKWLET